MPLIFYTLANGGQYEADAAVGESLMQVAEQSGIGGFLAECGGSATCGTCHCYIAPEHWDLLPVAEKDETDMLDFVAAERRPTSRLACQVKVTAAMEGLRVEVPGRQI